MAASKLSSVGSKYGAPMGRTSEHGDPEVSLKFTVEKLRWVDGDYDQGGAYWGYVAGTNIYRCDAADEFEGATDDITEWVRATSREDAKAQIVALHPKARFYR